MKAIETALSLTQAYKLGIERFEKMLGNEFTKAVELWIIRPHILLFVGWENQD